MHSGWSGYLMLRSKMSIHGSGRELIALGDAVGSLIVLTIVVNFDFEWPSNRAF